MGSGKNLTRSERELNENGWQKLSIKKSKEAKMPEQTESYQPSEEEVKKAEEMMTEEELKRSNERQRWFGRKNKFEGRASSIEQYLDLPEKEKAEMALAIDDDTLKGVYGEGYPLNLCYHEFGGINNQVAPASFWTMTGSTLVDQAKESGASSERIEAAQAFVGAYEEKTQEIIAKSEILKKLLAPVLPLADEKQRLKDEGLFKSFGHLMSEEEKQTARKRMDEVYNQPVSDEEINYLVRILGEGNFWVKDSKVKEEKTRIAYQRALEAEFGEIFRRFAVQSETPEEFEEYRRKMNEAYERLTESA